jgi:hypothetical protein
VVCDEHGIGGSGECRGDNDAHLDRINALYHEASDGKHVLCAVLFDLELGVIGSVKTAPKTTTKGPSTNSSDSPLSCSGFCSKLRAPYRGTYIGSFVCGARACSLCV